MLMHTFMLLGVGKGQNDLEILPTSIILEYLAIHAREVFEEMNTLKEFFKESLVVIGNNIQDNFEAEAERRKQNDPNHSKSSTSPPRGPPSAPGPLPWTRSSPYHHQCHNLLAQHNSLPLQHSRPPLQHNSLPIQHQEPELNTSLNHVSYMLGIFDYS